MFVVFRVSGEEFFDVVLVVVLVGVIVVWCLLWSDCCVDCCMVFVVGCWLLCLLQ